MDESEPEAARICVQDLVRINRIFGGHAILSQLLQRTGGTNEPFSLLDVGAASGDTAKIVIGSYPRARVVSLDRNAVHLADAPSPKVLADAFRLPFTSRSFDYVFSSLFLHHFTNDQIVELLRDFARIARKAVLISDLERHIVPYLFFPATKWVFRWHPIAVYDGKISIRAALTKPELVSLAQRAGLREVDVAVHRPAFRLSLVARV
jgi:ubiquinone/menaquinone biosynthesis C-methylase UbiE